MKTNKYPKYKNSGVQWLGDIPEHWEVVPGLRFLSEKKIKNKGLQRKEVLSLSYGKIRIKSKNELTGLVPESFETYQFVDIGDIIFRPTDLQNDKVSLRSAISEYNGIITSAYINLKINNKANSKFYHYLFRCIDNNKVIYGLGSGLRQNISYLDFRRFNLPFPPLQEQTAIAQFLDEKTSKIDTAITQKQELIALLKERKQIVIQNAVTKGLNPNTKPKDSGVEWIGEIPEHWEVKKLKFVVNINKKSLDENTSKNLQIKYVDIGSVNFENGIEKTEKFTFKNSPSRARRIAESGDTIISTVRTYLKAIDYVNEAKEKYIFSTGFAVLTPINISKNFLFHFVRSNAFTEQVTLDSKGMSYPAINSTDLSRLCVVVPSKREQQQIVTYIETQTPKIDKAISVQNQQIEKLKEYKATLIDSAVTGKIKVNF